jgi:hypothetical protein
LNTQPSDGGSAKPALKPNNFLASRNTTEGWRKSIGEVDPMNNERKKLVAQHNASLYKSSTAITDAQKTMKQWKTSKDLPKSRQNETEVEEYLKNPPVVPEIEDDSGYIVTEDQFRTNLRTLIQQFKHGLRSIPDPSRRWISH